MRLSTARPPIVDEPLTQFFASDGRIGLLYGNASLTRVALYGITLAAVNDHAVWVLDGANSFDAYFVACLARGWNHPPESILSRVQLSRAFTCYQLSESITRRLPMALAHPKQEAAGKANVRFQLRHPGASVFCIGLLETFYDEDVPITDAVRLLRSVNASLTELARQGHSIFITAREPNDQSIHQSSSRPNERIVLMNLLIAAATHIQRIDVVAENKSTVPTQLALIVA
jgi:hypothetical protein